MRYEHYDDLAKLQADKLISVRPHPTLPLFIYNYTAGAQGLPIKDWSPALRDCRGLILDLNGEVVGRPFTKFWNYEQVLDQIPSDLPFTVWEKLDGSLGIVCNYRGSLVVATRGSFESEQAKFAYSWLTANGYKEGDPAWLPAEHYTYLFEILYPENRIVVDYGEVRELRLLAVMEADGKENLKAFEGENGFPKVQGYPAGAFIRHGNETMLLEPGNFMARPNAEGYVIRWSNGFRAKVKFEEYKRLHRLITQVSTRSIWELLRAGKALDELVERVPEAFRAWVLATSCKLTGDFNQIAHACILAFKSNGTAMSRKDYAAWAKTQPYSNVLFALLDGKPTADMIWRMVEPKWATPFRPGAEE
jgi:RNA ligase